MHRLVFILLWLQNYLEKSGVWSQTQTFCNGGTCYSLHWDGGSFVQAKERCEANKGILTSMESEREAENIRQLLENNVNVVPQLHRLWIGLHRKVKQCYIAEKALRGFSWVSGNDHSTYNPWIREPLQTCIYKRCVELVVNFTTRIQLQWNDSKCDTKGNEGFICKYQMCESLNTDIGKVVYKPPLHTASQFFPRVPRGSVAIITCNNGNSVAVKCGQQPGQIKWLHSRNLESLCNNCWEITNNSSCQNGCFQTAEDDFCFCDKGFSVNLQQKKCVPEGDVENGFNTSTGTFLKVSEIAAANTISPVSGSASTTSIPLLGPAENSTATLPPTIKGSEPGKREARSNAPFLIYQVIIGVLALMLLVAVTVIIIRERGNRGAKKTEAKELQMETKNVDSVPQEDENASGRTIINVTNENHYVETPPASENEINVPKENGELSVSVAQ
ncbi:complement component C1q receptor-like [Pristis pectinata]|uniref:complement component C1q receptor-like n=1 Tax=Pristis pectinata TaxID=685728 RepID=UPI00223DB422|nr:complement component C1q receptor-like [Pristis pectinata]